MGRDYPLRSTFIAPGGSLARTMRRTLLIAVLAALLLPASATAASPLAGTSWVVKRVGGRVMPPGHGATLTFKAHHRIAGEIDCNSIGGHYRAGASRLRFLDVVSTAVGCEGATTPDFGRAMLRTRSYRLTGTRLLLLGKQGRTLARLAPKH
jgi:heat shock protein HslJ